MHSSSGNLVSRAVAMALVVSSTAAIAQESGEFTLEEVVITAQKREESLQTANLSVRAVTSDDLQRAGVQDINNLSKVAPELNVDARNNGTVVSIRGVRSLAFGPTDESANAIHIDGGYLARFQGLRGLFYDIQRIEVLSGPQGTLYGRNATGGAINVITNKPGKDFGGYANLEIGNYNLITAETAINVPLSDTFSVRVSGRHYKHDGYFTDTGTDDADQNSGRASVLWNISDTQTLLVSADIAHEGGKGPGTNIVGKGPAAYASVAKNGSSVPVSTNVPNDGNFYLSAPSVTLPDDPRHNSVLYGTADKNYISTQLTGFMAQYDHDLGPATLTVEGTYRELKNASATGTAGADVQQLWNVPAGFLHQQSAWKSFEARLTSTATEPLKWVGGVYLFQESLKYADFGNYVTNGATPAAPAPANPWTVANPDTNLNIINNSLDALAYAAFGEVTWSPLEKLHITGGLRYNVDEKEALTSTVSSAYTPAGLVTSTSTFPVGGGTAKAHWNELTWRFNVGYDITETNRVYANVARGYKSGGFAFGPRAQFDPEHITAYELGSKNEFMDNRIRLNGAVWYYDYTNFETALLQCTAASVNAGNCNNPSPAANAPVISVVNAGSARTYGASLSLDALITEADRVNLSVQYLDAKYVNFDVSAIAYVHPLSRADYSGTREGFAPEWKANATYDHTWKVGEGELDAQVAVQYSSKMLLANAALPGQSNYLMSDDDTTADVSVRWSPTEKWNVTAYVYNVTDELIVNGGLATNSVYNPPNTSTAYYFNSYAPPRTYGVILGVKF